MATKTGSSTGGDKAAKNKYAYPSADDAKGGRKLPKAAAKKKPNALKKAIKGKAT